VESRISPTASEVIEYGCDLKPDLIVSDLILRDMSAIEAGCQIRSLLPNCAVLFYSGAFFARLMDAQSQIAAGNALLRLAAHAASAQRMFLIRT
jgi:DNA-binding NarL/FixJ family response regulator